MHEQNKKFHIFISAAEPSADAHCAGLIAALKTNRDDIEFVGVGGPKMEAAGCELLENTVGKAVMIYKALAHLARYYKLIKRIENFLSDNKVNLVIVCDSPSFNFHVAKAAKKAGINTLFYVAPQLWAWGGWRIGKLRKYCDKLCCILLFEQDWFSSRGVNTTFVGNPLLDEVEASSLQKKDYSSFEPEKVKIALMPGSRMAEIDSLWIPMQQIALRIKEKYPAASFTTVAVDTERQKILKQKQITGFECHYTIDSVRETARTNDFSIAASGSATIEIAAAGCPLVIMYRSSKVLWHLLGRWIIKTKYLSLVNILAGKELVPEFMPYFDSIEPIANSIELLLQDRQKMNQISGSLIELVKPLSRKRACTEIAKIVTEMLV